MFHETVSNLCTGVVSAEFQGGAQMVSRLQMFDSVSPGGKVGVLVLLHNSIMSPLGAIRYQRALFRTVHAVLHFPS